MGQFSDHLDVGIVLPELPKLVVETTEEDASTLRAREQKGREWLKLAIKLPDATYGGEQVFRGYSLP